MLVLTRKKGETIIIQNGIEITVVDVKGQQIRLGIKAPEDVSILRKEVFDAIRNENAAAVRQNTPDLDKIAHIMKSGK